ncbi:MAG: hypothetical protein ACTSU2_14625 [Promethearchaeota archaeon]
MTKSYNAVGLNPLNILILIGLTILFYFLGNYFYRWYIKFAKKRKWVGKDIHKKALPEVAESGGLVFLILTDILFIILIFIFPGLTIEIILFLIVVTLAGLIGFIDDRIILSSKIKMVLLALIGIPITYLKFRGYLILDSPTIPIIGKTQLNIIYPLSIPIIILVLTNAMNMLEGYNGEGSGTGFIVITFMVIYSLISMSGTGLIFSIAVLGPLGIFLKYNKYPAKVFPGDVGTLSLGAIIAIIAIFGSLEVAMFCAILTQIFNAFYVIASLGGFKERHTIKTKDIILDENAIIHPSLDEKDHLTLPRLIVAQEPLSEKDLVKNIWMMSVLGALFGVVAEVTNMWTINEISGVWILITLFIVGIIYLIITKKFKAIRGLSIFMIAILLIGLGLLVVIDQFIVPTTLNWLLAGIIAGVGLFIWYYLSIKYFWWKISKVSGKKYNITLISLIKSLISLVLEKIKSILKGNGN